MVYGSLLKKGQVIIRDNIIIAKAGADDTIQYKRIKNGNIISEIIVKSDDLFLIPHPPDSLPEKGLYKHVMIEFDKELAISSRFDTKLEIRVPLDFAIATDPRDLTKVIDIFSLEVPKMAVYGSVQDGILTRYLSTIKDEGGVAILNVIIKNQSEETAAISRIVFASEAFLICFRENDQRVLGPKIKVYIKGSERALVEVLPPSCPEDHILISRNGKRILSEPHRFEMINGFNKGG